MNIFATLNSVLSLPGSWWVYGRAYSNDLEKFRVSRRALLKKLSLIGSSCALPAIVSGCLHQRSYRARSRDGAVFVPNKELSQLKSPADVLVVRPTNTRLSIVVRRSAATPAYVALSRVCTHRGCELLVRPNGMVCPCHGSSFDVAGRVLTGPATQPLRRWRTSMAEGGLNLWLRR